MPPTVKRDSGNQAKRYSAGSNTLSRSAGLNEGALFGDRWIATAYITIIFPLKVSRRLPLEICSISGAGLGIRRHNISIVIDSAAILFLPDQNASIFWPQQRGAIANGGAKKSFYRRGSVACFLAALLNPARTGVLSKSEVGGLQFQKFLI